MNMSMQLWAAASTFFEPRKHAYTWVRTNAITAEGSSIDYSWYMYVCMYLMIGKGQTVKKPYWGENRLKSKIKVEYKYLVVFWKVADPVPMLLQVANGSSA